MRELQVSVVCCVAPRQVAQYQLNAPPGSTVGDAIGQLVAATGVLPLTPDCAASVGVWGRKAGPNQVLRQGDRIELYRALSVDPKVARRERFKGQGVRAAGLFAKRRPQAKAGY
jgi:putative ubiquitin-RnfH superfamily antitoxin RatB of RatAB toxin-antitoxin module